MVASLYMNMAWVWKNNLKKNLAGIFALCMFMPMMPHGCSTTGSHKKHEEQFLVRATKSCPVSGERVHRQTKVASTYKDKTYNFCCTLCLEEFKKDPEKYIKNIQKENSEAKTLQGHQHSY